MVLSGHGFMISLSYKLVLELRTYAIDDATMVLGFPLALFF